MQLVALHIINKMGIFFKKILSPKAKPQYIILSVNAMLCRVDYIHKRKSHLIFMIQIIPETKSTLFVPVI